MEKRAFLWVSLVALVAICVLTGVKSYSQDIGAGMLFDNSELKQSLGLSDDQVTNLKGITEKYRNADQGTHDKVKTMIKDLSVLIQTDSPDLSKIDAKIDEISDVMNVSRNSIPHMLVEMRGILTPEQREKLQVMKQNFIQNRIGDQGNIGLETGIERVMDRPRLKQALGLSDDNVAALKAIAEKYRDTGQETREKIKTELKHLSVLIDTDSPNLSKIDSKSDELSPLINASLKNTARMMVEMWSVLTQEQREKLQDMKQKFIQNRGNGGLRSGGFRNGGIGSWLK